MEEKAEVEVQKVEPIEMAEAVKTGKVHPHGVPIVETDLDTVAKLRKHVLALTARVDELEKQIG